MSKKKNKKNKQLTNEQLVHAAGFDPTADWPVVLCLVGGRLMTLTPKAAATQTSPVRILSHVDGIDDTIQFSEAKSGQV